MLESIYGVCSKNQKTYREMHDINVMIWYSCQFQNFEWLVSPVEGERWQNAVIERDLWLNSTGVTV